MRKLPVWRPEDLGIMRLCELLPEKKPAVLEKWFEKIIESYPAETVKFLKTQKDRFANPVAHAVMEGIEGIFGELVDFLETGKRADPEKISPFLDNIIRIRAVQEFTPSGAISFIFSLKRVLREVLAKELREFPGLISELERADMCVDELALLSFDIYMKCREQLFEIKAEESRRSVFRLLQQAKIIIDGETGVADENKN